MTIMGGVPAYWREGKGDASADSGWKTIWPKLDIISPWTVGRFKDDAGADDYRKRSLVPDLAATKAMGVDYMPVVFPGFSWSNLMLAQHNPEKAVPNQIPRRCGAFYWHQVENAMGSGARMLYTAMFDEVDEATAMFKLDPDASEAPKDPSFVTLDADSSHVSSDWYLRLGGAVHAGVREKWLVAGSSLPDFATQLRCGTPAEVIKSALSVYATLPTLCFKWKFSLGITLNAKSSNCG